MKYLLRMLGIALISLPLPASLVAAETPLLAGVASVDITPEPGKMLWGYSNRTHGATGTLDPLMAKAVVFKVGETSVAIVSLDLGRVPEEAILAKIRARTKEQCGVESLFVTASHTHSAPAMESTPDSPNPYAEKVGEKIAEIIIQAAGKLEPVTIGVERGQANLGHNRRKFLPDGRVAMWWRNADGEPTEPVDREFAVIRLNKTDRSPLAVLFHYACHPVVLGPDNYQYSADFVGAASAVVERELKTTCLFLQGACGNINPFLDKTPLDQGGVAAMQGMGQTLGKLLVEAAKKVKPESPAKTSLQFEARVIPVRLRWDIEAPEVRSVLSQAYGPRFDNYLSKSLKNNIAPCTLTTVLINHEIALIGMPGEVFVEFQFALKTRSPVRNTFLVGYTNGYHAYFPTIRDAAAGGYGGKTATYVEPGAGERLTDQGLITLYTMLDQLHAKPRVEDFKLIEYDEIRQKPAK